MVCVPKPSARMAVARTLPRLDYGAHVERGDQHGRAVDVPTLNPIDAAVEVGDDATDLRLGPLRRQRRHELRRLLLDLQRGGYHAGDLLPTYPLLDPPVLVVELAPVRQWLASAG